jgi:hypothetical protein
VEEFVRVPGRHNPTDKKKNRSSKRARFASPEVSDKETYYDSDLDLAFGVGSKESILSTVLSERENQDEVLTKVFSADQMISVNKFLQGEEKESYPSDEDESHVKPSFLAGKTALGLELEVLDSLRKREECIMESTEADLNSSEEIPDGSPLDSHLHLDIDKYLKYLDPVNDTEMDQAKGIEDITRCADEMPASSPDMECTEEVETSSNVMAVPSSRHLEDEATAVSKVTISFQATETDTPLADASTAQASRTESCPEIDKYLRYLDPPSVPSHEEDQTGVSGAIGVTESTASDADISTVVETGSEPGSVTVTGKLKTQGEDELQRTILSQDDETIICKRDASAVETCTREPCFDIDKHLGYLDPSKKTVQDNNQEESDYDPSSETVQDDEQEEEVADHPNSFSGSRNTESSALTVELENIETAKTCDFLACADIDKYLMYLDREPKHTELKESPILNTTHDSCPEKMKSKKYLYCQDTDATGSNEDALDMDSLAVQTTPSEPEPCLVIDKFLVYLNPASDEDVNVDVDNRFKDEDGTQDSESAPNETNDSLKGAPRQDGDCSIIEDDDSIEIFNLAFEACFVKILEYLGPSGGALHAELETDPEFTIPSESLETTTETADNAPSISEASCFDAMRFDSLSHHALYKSPLHFELLTNQIKYVTEEETNLDKDFATAENTSGAKTSTCEPHSYAIVSNSEIADSYSAEHIEHSISEEAAWVKENVDTEESCHGSSREEQECLEPSTKVYNPIACHTQDELVAIRKPSCEEGQNAVSSTCSLPLEAKTYPSDGNDPNAGGEAMKASEASKHAVEYRFPRKTHYLATIPTCEWSSYNDLAMNSSLGFMATENYLWYLSLSDPGTSSSHSVTPLRYPNSMNDNDGRYVKRVCDSRKKNSERTALSALSFEGREKASELKREDDEGQSLESKLKADMNSSSKSPQQDSRDSDSVVLSLTKTDATTDDESDSDASAHVGSAQDDASSPTTQSKDSANDSGEPSCTPGIIWRRKISFSAKTKPTSHETDPDNAVPSDSDHDSSSPPTSSKDPVNDSDEPSTPLLSWRRNISFPAKTEQPSNETVSEMLALPDGEEGESSSRSTSSNARVNDSEEPSCTPLISWRRNISFSAKIAQLSNESVREASACPNNELEESSSRSTSSNDSEEPSCMPLISWRRNISFSAITEQTANDTVSEASARPDSEQEEPSSRSTSPNAPVNDSDEPSAPPISWRRNFSFSPKCEHTSNETVSDALARTDRERGDSSSRCTSSNAPVADSEAQSCTPVIVCRRNISLSEKPDAASDKVGADEWAGHDDELDDSSSLSTSSKDPANDLEKTSCTPLISWRRNISLSANIEPTSDEVVREESAGHDDALDDSSSLSTSSKDPANDSTEPSCTPLISWRRNISISANIEPTSDEVVRGESADRDDELDDSSSLFTSSKDPANDSEKTSCTPLISWRRNISISANIEPTSDEAVDDSSSLSKSSKDPSNGAAASSCTQVIMWRRHASCSMKRNSIPHEPASGQSFRSDSELNHSASHSSLSQDPLNESEETSCMPEIIWRRNSSPPTKSEATVDETVCDASFPNVSELEASGSHSTASKDPVND